MILNLDSSSDDTVGDLRTLWEIKVLVVPGVKCTSTCGDLDDGM